MLQRQLLTSIILIMLTAACGSNPSDGGGSSPAFRLYGDIGSEKAYCSPVSASSPTTTVTSTAQYQFRTVNRAVGLTTADIAPIRYAEVQILDSSGSTIQCGETDASGVISIAIPKAAGNYTLKVLSRADNNYFKASILNNPTSMEPYSISTTFTLDGSETTEAVTLTAADYRNTLEGGAFNILDQIFAVNQYIRTNSLCPSLGGVCTLYTVAPKVRIFWKPGLSPGAYFEEPTASISFYTASDDPAYGMASGIYMMGGINGDICVDTDHFDNSVIIHEYGHFLEKAFADSDSPGGSHNGNSVIDPRLAWSEGWANFIQGAVRNESRYVDTKGNVECSGGTGVNVDLNLENIVTGQDTVNSVTTFSGEGIFREVSVSRTLWDTMTAKGVANVAGADGFGANLGFSAIWKVFSDSTTGFRHSGIHFRNSGHFNEIMLSLVTTYGTAGQLTDFNNLIANEAQRSDRQEYARVVSSKPSPFCSEYTLQGTAGVNNYAKTNDFLSFYYDGSTANSVLTLKYSATGTPSDLDIYVWNEEHTIGNTANLAGSSAGYYPENGSAGIETVSLAGRPAGYYLIQIQADPDHAANTSNYYIETDSGAKRLCP